MQKFKFKKSFASQTFAWEAKLKLPLTKTVHQLITTFKVSSANMSPANLTLFYAILLVYLASALTSPINGAFKCMSNQSGQDDLLCLAATNNLTSFGPASGCFSDLTCQVFVECYVSTSMPGRLQWKLGIQVPPGGRPVVQGQVVDLLFTLTGHSSSNAIVFQLSLPNSSTIVYHTDSPVSWTPIDGHYRNVQPRRHGVFEFEGKRSRYVVAYFSTSSRLVYPDPEDDLQVSREWMDMFDLKFNSDQVYLTLIQRDLSTSQTANLVQFGPLNVMSHIARHDSVLKLTPVSSTSSNHSSTSKVKHGIIFSSSGNELNGHCQLDDSCQVVVEGKVNIADANLIDWTITAVLEEGQSSSELSDSSSSNAFPTTISFYGNRLGNSSSSSEIPFIEIPVSTVGAKNTLTSVPQVWCLSNLVHRVKCHTRNKKVKHHRWHLSTCTKSGVMCIVTKISMFANRSDTPMITRLDRDGKLSEVVLPPVSQMYASRKRALKPLSYWAMAIMSVLFVSIISILGVCVANVKVSPTKLYI